MVIFIENIVIIGTKVLHLSNVSICYISNLLLNYLLSNYEISLLFSQCTFAGDGFSV